MNRWPVQPLLDLGHTRHRICRVIGGKDFNRYIEHGLTDWQADRAAIRLGHFPSQVWPGWIDAGLTELDRRYLAGGWRQAWLWMEAV